MSVGRVVTQIDGLPSDDRSWQRGAKTHPPDAGAWSEISPRMSSRVTPRPGSSDGIEPKSARVYGWMGVRTSRSRGAISIIWPR